MRGAEGAGYYPHRSGLNDNGLSSLSETWRRLVVIDKLVLFSTVVRKLTTSRNGNGCV